MWPLGAARRACALAARTLAQQQQPQHQQLPASLWAGTWASASASTRAGAGVGAGTGSAQFASKAGSSSSVVVKKDWKAVKLPEAVVASIPTTTLPGQAFVGDLRSTSGLGMGDGKTTHTSKWLTEGVKSPMEYIQETEPIKVSGLVVASYGSDDPNLGCPVEYINLKGTTYDKPAVCKYTGNKFYSDDWKGGGHH